MSGGEPERAAAAARQLEPLVRPQNLGRYTWVKDRTQEQGIGMAAMAKRNRHGGGIREAVEYAEAKIGGTTRTFSAQAVAQDYRPRSQNQQTREYGRRNRQQGRIATPAIGMSAIDARMALENDRSVVVATKENDASQPKAKDWTTSERVSRQASGPSK